MESMMNPSSSPITASSSSSTLPIFFPRRTIPSRPAHFSLASKSHENEADPDSVSKEIAKSVPILSNRNLSLSPFSKDAAMGLVLSAATGRGWTTGSGMEGPPDSVSKEIAKSVPILSNRNLSLSPLSKDAAMGLVLNAATGRGWTTGSGMEGPPVPDGPQKESSTVNVSTFPWSLFTKSPRRRMLVAFTCNICGQRTTRAINPHAYTDGTVFVQCCGCGAFHKLVDNLNLFHEMNCYVNPSFSYRGNDWEDMNFKYLDIEDNDDDIFPIQ